MTPSSSAMSPSAGLRAMVETAVGSVDRYEERTVPLGEARVWAVWQGGVVTAWLKRHKVRDKAQREIAAYRNWLPRIGWGTPALLAVDPERPNALLTAAAPGERADRAVLTPTQSLATFRELGRFLAALHSLPIDDADPLPLSEAMPERAEAWCRRAEDVVDPDVIDAVRAAFAEPMPDGLERVPCHRDLQLHNLLIVPEGDAVSLQVIDFGQSRPDVWLYDLVKLFPQADPERLPLRRALLEGYGRRLRPGEADLLDRMRALHGLATVAWCSDHGDSRGVQAGMAVLEAAVERWRA